MINKRFNNSKKKRLYNLKILNRSIKRQMKEKKKLIFKIRIRKFKSMYI